MAKPKAKTEEKAKGLIGLNKGKKTQGAANSVGNYKGKTLNLSKRELGKAGQRAAGARTIDISKTQYDPQRKQVMGPMGSPITGRVDLGGGNIAVYKQGVRVSAKKASPRPVTRGGGTTTSKSGGPTSGRNLPVGTTGSNKPRTGKRNAISGTVSAAISSGRSIGAGGTSKPTASVRTLPSVAASGPAYGGRAGGSGPKGTPLQQKIRILKNKISAAQEEYNASAKKAARDEAYRAQAKKDYQTLQALKGQLTTYK